nr:hypothetical protein [Crucivirus sp.]
MSSLLYNIIKQIFKIINPFGVGPIFLGPHLVPRRVPASIPRLFGLKSYGRRNTFLLFLDSPKARHFAQTIYYNPLPGGNNWLAAKLALRVGVRSFGSPPAPCLPMVSFVFLVYLLAIPSRGTC